MNDRKTYAAYATRQSVGRPYPDDADPYRSDFRRDIGRVLYSRAFRRLAFKTQVFSPSEGDDYRNRLTHTLETAQIARSTAEALGLNEDLAEAIALAHDLGHPPFGHQGEAVLDELMKPYGGFDHNLQNLRVVMLLEIKSDRFRGLNLTFETLYGIAKSPAATAFLEQTYGRPPEQRIESVEARIAHYADDLAYTATDFDDFAHYHRLGLDDLRALPLALIRRCLPGEVQDVRIAVSLCVRNLVSTLVTDLIGHSEARLAAVGGRDASRAAVLPLIGLSPDMNRDYAELASFLRKHMYLDANLKAESLRGAEALKVLFASEARRKGYAPDDEDAFRALCDTLSGLTDRFAVKAAEGGEG